MFKGYFEGKIIKSHNLKCISHKWQDIINKTFQWALRSWSFVFRIDTEGLPIIKHQARNLHLSTQPRCQIPSPRVKKCAWSPVVKMMEKINNTEGNQWASRRAWGPLLFLLEQPFIRCSSCWVIYFSVLLAMLLSYGLADLWEREMGCLPASSQELD